MLTQAQIAAGGESLSETAINQWLMLIRALPEYRKSPGFYPSLETKLGSLKTGVIAPGDVIKAKVLNAALTQIEAEGAGMEALENGLGLGISWSAESNRNEFVRDGLNALYDAPARRPSSAVRRMSDRCGVHSCSLNSCGCSSFGGLVF